MKDMDVERKGNSTKEKDGEKSTPAITAWIDGRRSRSLKGESLSTPAIMAWLGGKRLLRSTIARYVPEQDTLVKQRQLKYYVEVFGGVAWMLLYKPRWFEIEIYNDANNGLVNLFNVIKYHPHALWNEFRLLPDSETMFEYCLANRPITDIQRAVATYVKYANSFSSKGCDYAFRPKSIMGLMKKIRKLSARLDKVSITNKSYEKIIPKFSRDNVFLYLDPPYYEKEYLYDVTFTTDDHQRLALLLKDFKGKFLLSYNNHPTIIETYRDFHVEHVTTKYGAFRPGEGLVKAREVVIMNY